MKDFFALRESAAALDEKGPKLGVDNIARIRAQDKNNKPVKAKPMTSTQRSLAAIRAKSESVEEAVAHPEKHIKMAIGIASDPRYKGGNMTGAHKAIEKISKGLASHPKVAAVLRRQNEELEIEEAKKVISPKQIRHALGSAKAQAKPKDQVSLKKAPWDKKESVEIDELDEAFENEYNDYDGEGSMIRNQLKFMRYAVEEMLDDIEDDDNLEEWVQFKLTKAFIEIEALHSYFEGQDDDDEEEEE